MECVKFEEKAWTGVKCTFILPVYDIFCFFCIRLFWVLNINLYPTVMSSINRNGSPFVVRAQIPSTPAKCWFHQRDFGKTDKFILRLFYMEILEDGKGVFLYHLSSIYVFAWQFLFVYKLNDFLILYYFCLFNLFFFNFNVILWRRKSILQINRDYFKKTYI